MKNKERLFYVAIACVILIFLVCIQYWPLDVVSKILTTCTALISAVAFWLQFKRSERLNESSYIMNMNNQFISNKDMTQVEHELELYYNNYEARFTNPEEKKVEGYRSYVIRHTKLGLSQSRTSENCQKLINYLVYLEALAALVDQQVIHLNVIDDLFSYRFFLAVNNPIVQEGELLPYKEFYKGVFKLSEYWSKKHKKSEIPMEEFSLYKIDVDEWRKNREKNQTENYHISTARGDDNKLEIAYCLYDTDRFIYPEAFSADRETGATAISRIIGMDGSLLDYKNFIVARYNGEICGVCLINDGTSKWDIAKIEERIGKELMPKSQREGFVHASNEYFVKECEAPMEPDTIELVAFCVNEGYRRKGVGSALLKKLTEKYSDKIIKLTVLERNINAIALYEQHGFLWEGKSFEGFAPYGLKKPMCIEMVRDPEKVKKQ